MITHYPIRSGRPPRERSRLGISDQAVSARLNAGDLVGLVVDTFKGQLDLELHGGRTPAGVLTRVWQRVLALTDVVWHNAAIGKRVKRSLTAYDH